MIKVGLTGSISVGKSYVLKKFEELGCYVLDADITAREVVAKGTIGLEKIVAEFGAEILNADGSLDRAKLGSIVFADEKKRLLLNSIVHPLVHEAQAKWLAEVENKDKNAIAIIDAALMIESGNHRRMDKLIVVWCDPDEQLKRLMKRNGINEQEAKRRIAAQLSQDEKKSHADLLIDTTDGFAETDKQVAEIYLALKLIV